MAKFLELAEMAIYILLQHWIIGGQAVNIAKNVAAGNDWLISPYMIWPIYINISIANTKKEGKDIS